MTAPKTEMKVHPETKEKEKKQTYGWNKGGKSWNLGKLDSKILLSVKTHYAIFVFACPLSLICEAHTCQTCLK